MRLARAQISHFRSLKNVVVDFGSTTALIGGNGAGKSSLLKALEKFYSTSRSLDSDDYYGRDTSVPVEISLTFDALSDDEAQVFGSRVRNRKLTVTRVFDTGPSSGRYHGVVPQNPEFQGIRSTPASNARRTTYNNLRAAGTRYEGLPTVTSLAALEQALETWEVAHPDDLQLLRDDGQFFGFQNASRGALQRFTSFVFIPAVREASTDAADAKSSPISQLLELLVRSAILQREDLQKFRAETNARYRELTAPENMPELGALEGQLTTSLRRLYENAAVGLNWRATADMPVPLPIADVSLTHDGFGGPVDRQGHGLQRAFIFTLLQELARATQYAPGSVEEIEIDAGEAPDRPRSAPNLILAIEEPELYQHPTKQRHLAMVLRQLSRGTLPGVEAATQIVFASHSPMFVSMPHVDEIRFIRRVASEEAEFKQCEAKALNLGDIAGKLEIAAQRQQGSFTAEGLSARLHILGPELSEGFFADGVVLVEGRSDKAALVAVAERLGVSFEAAGIAILAAEGKSSIDRPLLIFEALGIPTYPIWDCDGNRQPPEARAHQNLLLLRASDPAAHHVASPVGSMVNERLAYFEHNLEATLRAELDPDTYDQRMIEVCEEFGALRGDAQKNPEMMKRLLALAYNGGARTGTLEAIVRAAWRRIKGEELRNRVAAG